jgi:hypothetical protein
MQLIKLIFLLSLSVLFFGCLTTQYYYIKSAKLYGSTGNESRPFTEDREEPIRLLLNGHHIKAGSYLILLIRKFDRGSLFSIDDETYEKLTIVLKNFNIDEPIDFNSSSVQIYYSRGSSGFVRKGHGVYADSGKGTITIRKIDINKVIAEIDFKTTAKPAGAFPFESQQIEIQDSFTFSEIEVAGLTPWLGTPSPDIGKEVYP